MHEIRERSSMQSSTDFCDGEPSGEVSCMKPAESGVDLRKMTQGTAFGWDSKSQSCRRPHGVLICPHRVA